MEWINKLTIEERWLYGTIITFITGLVIVWISKYLGHTLASIRDKKVPIRNAVVKYKTSFAEQITYLNGDLNGINMFTICFYDTQLAVETIMPILPKHYSRKLNKAWDKYYGKNNSLELQPIDYVTETSSKYNIKEFKKFKKKI